jgi:hypothetical protein
MGDVKGFLNCIGQRAETLRGRLEKDVRAFSVRRRKNQEEGRKDNRSSEEK